MGLLGAMAESIRHRGPDGEGYWLSSDGRVGLAHRRLAIVDLSDAARQPMPNNDGSAQVVLNGEIYNFRELRAQLESKGHRFRSQSDTEVLVHLYDEIGEALIERLDGDFAFGLWDDRRKRLLLRSEAENLGNLHHAEGKGKSARWPPLGAVGHYSPKAACKGAQSWRRANWQTW